LLNFNTIDNNNIDNNDNSNSNATISPSKLKKIYSKTEELTSRKGDSVSAMNMKNGKFGNDNDEEDDESEIAISTEQFKERINVIYTNISNYLFKEKTNIRVLFKDDIYSHKVKNDEYEAINLQKVCELFNMLEIINDTVDIYCIYSDLKYNEDYETVDVVKFEKRLERYISSHKNKENDHPNNSAFKSEKEDEDENDRTINSNDVRS